MKLRCLQDRRGRRDQVDAQSPAVAGARAGSRRRRRNSKYGVHSSHAHVSLPKHQCIESNRKKGRPLVTKSRALHLGFWSSAAVGCGSRRVSRSAGGCIRPRRPGSRPGLIVVSGHGGLDLWHRADCGTYRAAGCGTQHLSTTASVLGAC